MNDLQDRLAALDAHVASYWPTRHREVLTWGKGPIEERVPGFRVLRVEPAQALDAWVYVSVGASTSAETSGLEYFVMSPAKDDLIVETLAMVAHFQSFAAHPLAIGSIINIGRPWFPGSQCDHLVVTLPYPFGPSLEIAEAARFVWLVPITASEAAFIRESGFDTFEDRLEASGVDVIDPKRRAIA
ncbi:suppressor of fused domain protein [Catenulispora sp. NF23]|uniref:Suppressor of fused domain protein n=1 Tax=Catenulispora pinistramenti TaxID=2705254 RepID=A0ABS5L548_9ACTN|nr:suppressor of fused domain protein [Catenulispora pinistramenti]MBS2531622.1 suppressor of fused domain protein [Catenulispora pinistramenti]MBS2553447.1 suppressor of fused domain protein [Catenulispora pinistramenti]